MEAVHLATAVAIVRRYVDGKETGEGCVKRDADGPKRRGMS
jgi:hypothetical protein